MSLTLQLFVWFFPPYVFPRFNFSENWGNQHCHRKIMLNLCIEHFRSNTQISWLSLGETTACHFACWAAIWREQDELLLTDEGWGIWWSLAPTGSKKEVLPCASPGVCSSLPLCPLSPSSVGSFCLIPILSPALFWDINFSHPPLLAGDSLPKPKQKSEPCFI